MQQQSVEQQQASPAYAWYVVILLTCAYILSYLDRWVMSLLVELIKADLELTDSQMGLLLGFAFALFYATMGIPLGWLADRFSRRNIVAIGITIWCAATAAAGLSRNFAQLFVTRMLVGVGEATLSPCALGMITDYFPPKSRGRAIAFYTGAVSIGSGIAYLVGGQIIQWAEVQDSLSLPFFGEIRPWQVVFLAVGAPGLLIAALMFTVREPMRTGTAATAEMGAGNVGFPTAFRYLIKRWRSFGGVFLCMSCITILAYSHAWLPAYFSRTWEWDIPKFSVYNGIGLIIVGPLSVNFGGWLADRLQTRGRSDGPVIVVILGRLDHGDIQRHFPADALGHFQFRRLPHHHRRGSHGYSLRAVSHSRYRAWTNSQPGHRPVLPGYQHDWRDYRPAVRSFYH